MPNAEQMNLNFNRKSEANGSNNLSPLQELVQRYRQGGELSAEERGIIDEIREAESEGSPYKKNGH